MTWRRRSLICSLLLSLLVLSALFGCRAFQPEIVVVNKPPETYIMGAPAESSGGYYHFHLYWYGTDADGEVTRFVWALTDSSVQDPEREGDEEDTRFNPATNVTTLQIGHYTVRTDSVFDFQINLDANLAAGKTFHIVAIDDRGDFDRTPARLQFITNAIGTPRLTFYHSLTAGQGAVFANYDTIGYGQPFEISWQATTPNLRSYEPELLALRDTVPPLDGLFGYKYRVVDIPCNDTTDDCWQPRYFDTVSGDSVSFFGTISGLAFSNDDTGPTIYQRRLPQGLHRILVNTLDMAGVEIPPSNQALNYVLNYDPGTRILRGETDSISDDPKVYPYFVVFHPDGTTSEHAFAEGDTVPDKSYVVFKAVGWDDPRDIKTGTADYEACIQGNFRAVGMYEGQSRFEFFTEKSEYPHAPGWVRPAIDGGGVSDTLGFLVGPFQYTVEMNAVDEWGRRDGTPEQFTFWGNRPPCVQCVELLVGPESPATSAAFGCMDAGCAAEADTIYAAPDFLTTLDVPASWRRATQLGQGLLWYNAQTGGVWLDEPLSTVGPESMPGYFFEYKLALHGADHPLEPWHPLYPERRIPSWNYEVRSDRDALNIMAEGGGYDALNFTTFHFERENPTAVPPQPIAVDDEGVWIFRFKFFVPQDALFGGEDTYLANLQATKPNYLEVFRLTTLQLGPSTAYVQANDASNCAADGERAKYYYYRNVRVPLLHGLECDPGSVYENVYGSISLENFRFKSREIFEKRFVIKVVPIPPFPIFP